MTVRIWEVRVVPASQSDGLQTADMLAGLVRTEEQSLAIENIKVIKYPPNKKTPG
ncbi:MAG: hypothetical protein Q7U34_03935 [Anaerolineales bacterium]|nr:hypothetical protein [Anaerolineales bacterium]